MYLGSEIVIPALICMAIFVGWFFLLKMFLKNKKKPKEERKTGIVVGFVFGTLIFALAVLVLMLLIFLSLAVAHM